MTPFELESLIDDHGTVPERWPAGERAAACELLATSEAARTVLRRARRLEALLRVADHGADHGAEVLDPDHVRRVIALTRAAAYRTPQVPPPPLVRLRRWCLRRFAMPDEGLWRYGVPVAVGLVLGVLVGHASVDPVADTGTEASATVEALITVSQSAEPFGL